MTLDSGIWSHKSAKTHNVFSHMFCLRQYHLARHFNFSAFTRGLIPILALVVGIGLRHSLVLCVTSTPWSTATGVCSQVLAWLVVNCVQSRVWAYTNGPVVSRSDHNPVGCDGDAQLHGNASTMQLECVCKTYLGHLHPTPTQVHFRTPAPNVAPISSSAL